MKEQLCASEWSRLLLRLDCFLDNLDVPPLVSYPRPRTLDIAGRILSNCVEIVPVKWHREMFTHTLEGPDDMTGHVKVRSLGKTRASYLIMGMKDVLHSRRSPQIPPLYISRVFFQV